MADPDSEQAPFLGSWGAIYAVICVAAVIVMVLIALFTGWRF